MGCEKHALMCISFRSTSARAWCTYGCLCASQLMLGHETDCNHAFCLYVLSLFFFGLKLSHCPCHLIASIALTQSSLFIFCSTFFLSRSSACRKCQGCMWASAWSAASRPGKQCSNNHLPTYNLGQKITTSFEMINRQSAALSFPALCRVLKRDRRIESLWGWV